MATKLEFLGLATAAVAVGTVYVLVHEARRKRKKAEKVAAEAPISKETLLKILNKSAEASKAVIERVRPPPRSRRRLTPLALRRAAAPLAATAAHHRLFRRCRRAAPWPLGLGFAAAARRHRRRRRRRLPSSRAPRAHALLSPRAHALLSPRAQIRVEVRKIQQQRNLSDEQALQLFQSNFEHSLDQLIGAIRKQQGVTEKAMDASFKMHQADPEVQQAIQNMRMLSAASASPASSPNGGGGSGGGAAPRRGSGGGGGGGGVADVTDLPESLTKHRLKEIMTFNAVMLEKELRPIKEQVERLRKEGKPSNLDPQLLMQVQMRISQAVQGRFGVTDEQVMAAVEVYGAKSDPGFKDILQRIATTLSTAVPTMG